MRSEPSDRRIRLTKFSRYEALDRPTMTPRKTVYLLVLSGEPLRAAQFAHSHYPGFSHETLSKEHLLEGGWRRQLREFRRLRGEALIMFSESLRTLSEPEFKLGSGLIHRCRTTVFADSDGNVRRYTRWEIVGRLPGVLWSGLLDLATICASEVGLRAASYWLARPLPLASRDNSDVDLAFLYPFPLLRLTPGGELSYLKGSLSGLASASVRCEVFSGCPLEIDDFRVHEVPNKRRWYLFKECQALSYNLRFIRNVRSQLGQRRPYALYQRHGRFVFAGAVLSRLLKAPLVLEYQNSEYWWAKTWDPGARFLGTLRRCEDAVISATSLFVVLSEALRDELEARGVPRAKIVVNPAAVDPDRFRPADGAERVRQEFDFGSHDVVVCFVGSFSYWHGIPVLEQAIRRLLQRGKANSAARNLRFLLVGDGPLRREMEQSLRREGAGSVVFTGAVGPDRVPGLLDASDILVSPHLPMPDDQPFFGSPSKLFEYMAMAKAIVASDLDQLSSVLMHRETAWLVRPGDDADLAHAIEELAADEELRKRLGQRARASVVEHHTWRQNALRLVAQFSRDKEPSISAQTR
jgi:glycosyltransferase involved in cell wall biosynthesis